MMTAEEIYHGINSGSITGEAAIKLIENYGLQNQRNAMAEMQKEMPILCSEEIEDVIRRIITKLDDLSEITLEACKRK